MLRGEHPRPPACTGGQIGHEHWLHTGRIPTAPPAPSASVHGRRRRMAHRQTNAWIRSRTALRTGSRGGRRSKRIVAVEKPKTDTQGLVELSCECTRFECERTVKVPLYVYQRTLDADQYLLQAGHHGFPQYRTIISIGLYGSRSEAQLLARGPRPRSPGRGRVGPPARGASPSFSGSTAGKIPLPGPSSPPRRALLLELSLSLLLHGPLTRDLGHGLLALCRHSTSFLSVTVPRRGRHGSAGLSLRSNHRSSSTKAERAAHMIAWAMAAYDRSASAMHSQPAG